LNKLSKAMTMAISMPMPSARKGWQTADVIDHPAEVLAEEAGDERERQEDSSDHRQLLHDAVEPV
jgi:hypothetical protein